MKLKIKNLEFYCVLGLLESERNSAQKIRINATIFCADSNNFVDYVEVAELIKSVMIKNEFELIETALKALADAIFKRFILVKKIKIEVLKPMAYSGAVLGVKETFLRKSDE